MWQNYVTLSPTALFIIFTKPINTEDVKLQKNIL